MGQRVKIKVRVNQPVHFPGLCVNCARPAAERMGIRRRIGRTTRFIDVPLCGDCHQQLKSQSFDEQRLQRLSRLVGALTLSLVLALSLLLTTSAMDLILRVPVALFVALVATKLVLMFFERARREAALPAKQAIYDSAQVAAFSWRATVFKFSNEVFAERFRDLNEYLLMET
jgi:hypothetical protein